MNCQSIPELMKVAVMTEIGKIEYEQRPVPTPKDDEVLIRLEYVGICGSDLHFFETGRIGDCIATPPFVLGHEPGGVVVKTGAGVTSLSVGDRVALEPGKTCGHCEYCTSGRYNLCPKVEFFATPPYDGVFSEYAVHPASLCFPLPESVSTLEGALIEPLAVGFHAASQGGAKEGRTALVYGAGCIGLCCMMALRAAGVKEIVIVDVLPARLEKARELGCPETVNAADHDAVEQLSRLFGGKGYDLIIETAGTEATTRQAIEIARKGADIVLVGYTKSGEVTLPMSKALDKELTLHTTFRYRYMYPKAIKAVDEGIVDLKNLASHVFEFDNLQYALDQCLTNKSTVLKGVVRVSGAV